MAYTAGQLLIDVISRVGNLPANGISFYGAANSITSLIFKKLLERKSDLIATGYLVAIIPSGNYIVNLPSDWMAPAEKPSVLEVAQVATDLTTALVTAGLTVDNQTILAGMFAAGSVDVNDIQALIPATNVQSIIDSLSSSSQRHHLQPSYLDDDMDHDDFGWWSWYGSNSVSFEHPAYHPRKMKIINTTMYVRPKVINDVVLKARYHQMPTEVSTPTSNLQYGDKFAQVYREGVVKIAQLGISIPEADQAFAAFIHREIDTVLNARIGVVKDTHRMRRSSYL